MFCSVLKTMNRMYKPLGYLAIGLITIGLFSCSSSDAANSGENQDIQKTRDRIEAVSSQLVQPFNPVAPALAAAAASDSTVTVTMYKVDNNCQSLNPETITGPDNQLMSSTVNEVLKQQVFTSLGLVGYRLRIDRTLGVATVDLRTSGNDRQKLQNLSSCQMLGLFGGIRQTLTSYTPWQIRTVRFTELGEDILSTVRE